MSAKSSSPEAAQKRVWKAELKTLEKNLTKIERDVQAAFRRSQKEADVAVKAANKAHQKHLTNAARLIKAEQRETTNIKRRIAILHGRIGI